MWNLVIKKDVVFLVSGCPWECLFPNKEEASEETCKETEANVNSSEYALFTQSHAWSVKIVLWSGKSQGIFFILMGGNPV